MSATERRRLCGPLAAEWRTHRAKTRLKAPEADGTDQRAEPYLWTVMNAAASAYGLNAPRARSALIGNLRRWAKGGALSKLARRNDNTYYTLDRALLPLIVAFALTHDHPAMSAQERDVVHAWLADLVRLRGAARDAEAPGSLGPITTRNNHHYLRRSVDIAWAAFTGDAARFALGLEAYRQALAAMRPDGGLPLEIARDGQALYYQRHALSSLVTIAEIAALQGVDLYALSVEGRTLHDGVAFLARALDDADLGRSAGLGVQDTSFLHRRGHARHYMAWLEIYAARFPERPATRRLQREVAARAADWRPMIDEYAGGNTSCFFAPVTAR